MIMDLTQLNFAEMPWYVTLTAVVLSALLSFFGTRLASRDQKDSALLTQTMQRQTQMDEFQQAMIKEYKDDHNRLRDDISLMRKEVFEERKKSAALEKKMTKLEEENLELRNENIEIRKENHQLKELVEEMKTQIKQLKQQGGGESTV